jgi:DNA-directed RNA polymerase subunit RPC12/RpoP/ribosomal protein S27AE
MSDDRYFEELLSDGITALKGGDRYLARRLLQRAALVKTTDARPWLWLSGTTDDPNEQRQLLEKAVAADPSNPTAARGLNMLRAQMAGKPVPAAASSQPSSQVSGPSGAPKEPQILDAQAQTFLCPKCGGHMSYNVHKGDLACEFCGYVQVTEKRLAADDGEVAIGFVLPTQRAHRWAEAQHRLSCERCGALTLLPPTLKADQCPYCGSNRLIESAETTELVDPQVVALMKIDENEAYARVRKWLKKGFFSPGDLALRAGGLRLRPAFYPVWTFDGTLEISWVCEVNVGSNDHPRWVTRNGVEAEMFDDVLVPGMKALKLSELVAVEPFNLKDVIEFHPEYVAGWPVLSYDRPLSDASLLARERVIKDIQRGLSYRIEAGEKKRNLRTGAGQWSGITFKHLLLPMWTGTYRYQGKEYSLMVNGQMGKVAGKKPRDTTKIVVTIAGSVFLGLLLILALAIALGGLGGL